jgi:DHHC palmitoyltransferase
VSVPLQRNYRWFLCFVFSTTLLCVWVFTLSLVQLLKYTDNSGRDFGHAIRKYPASLVCMIYSFLAFWCGPEAPPTHICSAHTRMARVLLMGWCCSCALDASCSA